jgi:hypothetical protein
MKLLFTRSFRGASALAVVMAFALAASAFAGTVPGNLGSGLDVLVREHQAQIAAAQSSDKDKPNIVDPDLVAEAHSYRENAFVSDKGQVKVYVHLRPATDKASRRAPLTDVLPPSAVVSAVDPDLPRRCHRSFSLSRRRSRSRAPSPRQLGDPRDQADPSMWA